MNGGRVATVVLGAVAAVLLAVMVAPAAVQRVQDRMDHTARYASGAAAKADRTEVPRWLPDTATGVAFLGSDRQNDRLIRATLPERALPADCTAGRPLGDVHLRAPWFPRDTPQRATAHCGLYDVALVGDQLYGWQDAAVVAASRTTGPTGH
ncbi:MULTISPECIES: hypothetical protein [Kitasatospora]|uniref:Uncharacterized protein n=1 Tax=Kitasatospora setae (strain ATCC 33774 / DSM 43861 / JCM 3304 / KCC A-0304 / NBRC 14216 / KM-6054) TaxID=452652 RepID=E4N1B8_KITSK|nr:MULTISPECIES: hypothetical protein [Kitasatospora]BAJ31952.1 hypothetical protein KSE_61870 [Kitasatospora setae KM-6054]